VKLRVLVFTTAIIGVALAVVGLVVEEISFTGMTVDLRWMSWAIFLCGYAVCSGSNVAYFALSRRDLRKVIWRGHNAPEGSPASAQARRASALLEHLRNPNWTLASILLTNVGFGVYLSQLSDTLFIGILAVVMPMCWGASFAGSQSATGKSTGPVPGSPGTGRQVFARSRKNRRIAPEVDARGRSRCGHKRDRTADTGRRRPNRHREPSTSGTERRPGSAAGSWRPAPAGSCRPRCAWWPCRRPRRLRWWRGPGRRRLSSR